MKIESQEYFC